MISIIIPTYKEPDYLDLCIKSILATQIYHNEIVVIVDGTLNVNDFVLKKYENKIAPIVFETNYGQSKATNFGVYNAKSDIVLIVNDDQVFPKEWDKILLENFNKETDVISPNQIEPYDSMFKQFIKYDFGKDAKTFNLNNFYRLESTMRQDKIDDSGSTLPFLMSKINYLKVGGWDETYPSGNVVDWDFFLKCNLCGLKLKRNYKCNLYHFISIGTRSPEQVESTRKKEIEGFEYFKYKWGAYPKHDVMTNLKSI